MLIDFKILENYNVIPKGVIHVGMHKAEEYPIYKACGVNHIIFIEANEKLARECMLDDNNCQIINAAVSDCEEYVEFTITNNGESSSILELGDHASIYPNIVAVEKVRMKTTTLDRIVNYSIDDKKLFQLNNYNIINLDIQGAELKAMKGLTDWSCIEAVFTEVNYRDMYKGCALVSEIDEFLDTKGFKKVEEVDTGAGWGDALYIKR